MDCDQLSIASDFSVIPESMVHLEDMDQAPAPMCVSFFQSLSSGAASHCDKVAVTFGTINTVGDEPNISLSVIFWFSDQFKPTTSDRIALYKVGFSSTKDFLCYKWVPVSGIPAENSGHHRSYTVDFEADMLPRDPDGYYQICYLTKSGHILGVSTTFTLKETEIMAMTNEVEEAARNVLSVRIRELVRENTELGEELEAAKKEVDHIKDLFEELEKEHQGCLVEKDDCRKLIQNLKETAKESEAQIEKLKMEILEKEDELKQETIMTQVVQGRLTEAVLHLNTLRDRLSESVEEKSISEERHQVLMEDNQDLKENLRLVKEELEISMKEKVAAEKIASGLSQEVQATREEFGELGLVNLKLTKKIKKLRRVIALMEATNDDFICVEEDPEERRDEEEEEKIDDGAISASMSASHASGVISQCPSSTCSQKLNETVVSVKKTMDEIVHQLSEQTEEMKSLKREISRKSLDAETLPIKDDSKNYIEGKKGETHGTDDKVLYEHSFLPAHCTAPVFLPARRESPKKSTQKLKPVTRSTTPSAPSPTPSMMEDGGVELPCPLRPVKTETARNAAVLRHFTEGNSMPLDGIAPSNSVQLDGVAPSNPVQVEGIVQQPRQQCPKLDTSTSRQTHQQESDDEDYHSTGDAGEQTLINCLPSSLKCPMCPLEFQPSGIHLLNDHINNHLDRTCPVCSLAFQRSTPQKRFEEHVQAHFENENDVDDPSGPWDPRDPTRSFQLLEID